MQVQKELQIFPGNVGALPGVFFLKISGCCSSGKSVVNDDLSDSISEKSVSSSSSPLRLSRPFTLPMSCRSDDVLDFTLFAIEIRIKINRQKSSDSRVKYSSDSPWFDCASSYSDDVSRPGISSLAFSILFYSLECCTTTSEHKLAAKGKLFYLENIQLLLFNKLRMVNLKSLHFSIETFSTYQFSGFQQIARNQFNLSNPIYGYGNSLLYSVIIYDIDH